MGEIDLMHDQTMESFLLEGVLLWQNERDELLQHLFQNEGLDCKFLFNKAEELTARWKAVLAWDFYWSWS